jgi:hypothetical protein
MGGRQALARILLTWRRMRSLLLGIVLVLGIVSPARADGGLTDAVGAAYFPRNVDEGLHAIAHERVAELRACKCLEHDGQRPGTAEVLYTVTLGTDPIGSALRSWAGSPLHNGILADRSYGRIGCAVTFAGDIHWVACVLAAGPLPAAAAPSAPTGGFLLPDTALLARPPSPCSSAGMARAI